MDCETLRASISAGVEAAQEDKLNDEEEAHLNNCDDCISWLFCELGPAIFVTICDGRLKENRAARACVSCRMGLLGYVGMEYAFPWHLHVSRCGSCQRVLTSIETLLGHPVPGFGTLEERVDRAARRVIDIPSKLRSHLLMLDLPMEPRPSHRNLS
jgi:hypothetical protein